MVNNESCSFGNACILLNNSYINFNLNGYNITNNASCSNAFAILPKDTGDYSQTWDNIQIANGRIKNFVSSGIELYGSIQSSSFTYIDFIDDGDGISLTTGYDNDVIIGENLFVNVGNAVIGSCLDDCRLYDNEVQSSVNGFYLTGNGFNLLRNIIGSDNPMENGIYCIACNNTVIDIQDITAKYSLIMQNSANNNTIKNSVFRKYYNYIPVMSFDSSTSDNIFCNNLIIQNLNTSVNTINAKNYVINNGSGNNITEFCSSPDCQSNWYCQNNNRIFINDFCSITYNYTCQYGCSYGIYGSVCIGQQYLLTTTTSTTVLIQKWNISYDEPLINQTDFQEAGLNFLIPFFTPTFLIVMFMILVSSGISFISKQKIAFPITIFLLSAIYGIYGMFSFGIALVVCIISALSVALFYKSMVK
jgi:hypothetical protein